MSYVVKYIIHEAETSRVLYRTLDTESGKMRDLTLDIVHKYNVDVSRAVTLQVKNLIKFTGRLKKGINDFETWCRLHDNLKLLEEYDTSLNPKTVDNISKGAIDMVWWKCKDCGHQWQTNIKTRVGAKSGCPECAYKKGKYHKLVVGDNDFETYCLKNGLEHLLKEYSRLNKKKPNEIAAKSSGESILWDCSRCGRQFKNYPANRINGQGCPNCSSTGSSIPETIIYYFLSEELTHIEYRKKINGLEADIYLPDYKTVIDYRGEYWHGTDDKRILDSRKVKYFNSLGIKQIIIEERRDKDTVTHYSQKDNCIYFKPNQYDKLFSILKEILKLNIEINDKLLKRVQHIATIKKQHKEVINSVAELYPEVAERWDYERNKDFLPTQVTSGTSLKAWFKCPKCHNSYYAFIRKQVQGQGCSYCNGTTAYRGINDIATTLPGIMFVWDFEKNDKNSITPYNIKAGSGKKIHLKCFKCGAEREISPCTLSLNNTYRCKNCGIKLKLDE